MPESKSELKRLCVQKPISMAEYMHKLQQENAKLREQLADVIDHERQTVEIAEKNYQRAEAAEAKLKAASEQEPVEFEEVGYAYRMRDSKWHLCREDPTSWANRRKVVLLPIESCYAAPVPPVDVQELQLEVKRLNDLCWNTNNDCRIHHQASNDKSQRIAELERKLAEQQAIFKAIRSMYDSGNDLDGAHVQSLRLVGDTELNHLLAQAREEGRRGAVPDADWLSNAIREVDGQHNLGAGALAEMLVSKMLSASPKPE